MPIIYRLVVDLLCVIVVQLDVQRVVHQIHSKLKQVEFGPYGFVLVSVVINHDYRSAFDRQNQAVDCSADDAEALSDRPHISCTVHTGTTSRPMF